MRLLLFFTSSLLLLFLVLGDAFDLELTCLHYVAF